MLIQPTIFDWIQWLFLVIAVGFFIYIYSRISSQPFSKFLFRAFLIKVLGGLAFACVYIYYYKFGDSFRYYYDITKLNNVFMTDTAQYFRLMMVSDGANSAPGVAYALREFSFAGQAEGWFMVRISSPFGLLTANSYLGITFFTSIVSLIGGWQLFKLSNRLLNNNYKWSFAIAFLIPSTIFWGGGLLKDTYTLFAVSVWALALYKILHKEGTLLFQIVLLAVMSYVLYVLKAYILICMLPWLFVSLYLLFSRGIKSKIIKYVSVPIILGVVATGAYFVSITIVDSSDKYKTETLETRANGFQSWHKTLGGSYYDIGEVEYTPVGILSVAPRALVVTLFRPYPWEVHNVFMVLSSLEGIVFFGLVLWAFSLAQLRLFKELFRSTFLFGAFLYCVIFGVAIGMNSYNFGALVRYKLPMLGFFVLILAFLILKFRDAKSVDTAPTD